MGVIIEGRSVNFREFKLSDLSQILRLEEDLFGIDAYGRLRVLDGYYKAGKGFIVAEADGEILGYITGFAEQRRGFIDNLAVTRHLQRKGLGQVLLKAILKHFTSYHLKKIELMVRTSNLAAVGFYQKAGFAKIKLLKNVYADGGCGFLMRLRINE